MRSLLWAILHGVPRRPKRFQGLILPLSGQYLPQLGELDRLDQVAREAGGGGLAAVRLLVSGGHGGRRPAVLFSARAIQLTFGYRRLQKLRSAALTAME